MYVKSQNRGLLCFVSAQNVLFSRLQVPQTLAMENGHGVISLERFLFTIIYVSYP